MARAQRFFRVAGILAASYLFSSFAAHAVVPLVQQPSWAELSVQQREILAPLASEWDKLEDPRRVKWLGIAARYPTMQPEEQQRIQKQMLIWARLTPEERQQAREKYKSLKKAPVEKRETLKQKWEQYQELPEEEKLRLKQQAVVSPLPKKAKTLVKVAKPVKPLSQAPATAVPSAVPAPIVPIPPVTAPAPTSSQSPATTVLPAAPAPVAAPQVAADSPPPAVVTAPVSTGK